MKKQLLILLFGSSIFAASSKYDLDKGVDFTGETNITTTLLNNLVDMATIKTDRGMFIFSTNVPDVAHQLRFTNFVWMDTRFSPPYAKQWIGGGGTDYTNETNWALLIIPNLSITSNKLVSYSVNSRTIATNAINQPYMLGPSFIDQSNLLYRTITSNNIAYWTLLGSNIAYATITHTNIAPYTILPTNVVWPFITNINMLASNMVQMAILTNWMYYTNGSVGASFVFLPGEVLANQSVSGDKLANKLVTTNIAEGGIVASNIANITITSNKLAFGSVTDYQLNDYNATYFVQRVGGWVKILTNGVTISPNTEIDLSHTYNVTSYTNSATVMKFWFLSELQTTNYCAMTNDIITGMAGYTICSNRLHDSFMIPTVGSNVIIRILYNGSRVEY